MTAEPASMVTTWIRIWLTVILLVIVWQHAHWSVAACLTLLFVNSELIAVIMRLRWRR